MCLHSGRGMLLMLGYTDSMCWILLWDKFVILNYINKTDLTAWLSNTNLRHRAVLLDTFSPFDSHTGATCSKVQQYTTFLFFFHSPLSCGVVDLITLATAYCDGIKRLEGSQANAGDSHKARRKHDHDGFGVVKRHWQVMVHGDHQGVIAAAQTPLTCGEDIWCQRAKDKTVFTETKMRTVGEGSRL